MEKDNVTRFEKLAYKIAQGAGSPTSILIHTLIFIGAFIFILFGADFNRVLLVLTTAVSLEAIYLSLFIQITVNMQTKHLKDVKEEIEDIQENIEDLNEESENQKELEK